MPPAVETLTRCLVRLHAELVDAAEALTASGMRSQSYCTGWSVAQVYGHLGSGAEIGLAGVTSARTGGPAPDPGLVWARWDAMEPEEAVRAFATADRAYLEVLAATAAEEPHLRVPVHGMRLDLPTWLLLRLSEVALHGWDVRVVSDPSAEVDSEAALLLTDHYPRQLVAAIADDRARARVGPAALRVEIAAPARSLLLRVSGQVQLEDAPATGAAADGILRLPGPGAWVRLLSGRLDDAHLPGGTAAEGRPSLEELRALFTGGD